MKAVYRVVSALLAALIFPAMYFLNLIHYIIELKITEGYLNDNIVLQEIINIVTDFFKKTSHKPMGAHLTEVLMPLKASAIVTAVFIVLTVLMALAVIFCSAFTNARKVNLCFAVGGIISTIGAMAAFNHMTSLIINGTVSVSSVINAAMSDSSSFLAGVGALLGAGGATEYLGKLLLLRLGSAFTATVILFSFIVLWTLAFLLIELDPDAKAKKSLRGQNKKLKGQN
ncbi:MAG: hypothetical protein IJU96_10270 [Clostridia bacterium]|nr:hypothetical protein [Clostridia bacterium]